MKKLFLILLLCGCHTCLPVNPTKRVGAKLWWQKRDVNSSENCPGTEQRNVMPSLLEDYNGSKRFPERTLDNEKSHTINKTIY